jgi:pectin methylesterase-like acyl-CoA thioesterase
MVIAHRSKTLACLLTVLLAVAAFGQPPAPRKSTTGPVPPPQVRPPLESAPASGATSAVIAGVPAYIWRHGCGPTAVGMVAGYYDAHGYPDIFPGDGATQTAAVSQGIASQGSGVTGSGEQRHYEDYSLPLDDDPPLLPDRSQNYPAGCHANDCIADYMHTSWSADDNLYGASWSDKVAPGFTNYVVSRNTAYRATVRDYYMDDGTLTWDVITREIDANRPMVFLVDSSGKGATDHFVTIVGYDNGAPRRYACMDTWYTAVRWCEFRPISAAYAWGVWGAWAFQMVPDTIYVNDASFTEPGSRCAAPGNDANDGASPAKPMRTIQAALNKYPTLGADIKLWVDPGLYVENVTVGAAHSNLEIQGAGARKTIVDGGAADSCFVLDAVNPFRLAGMTLRNGKAAGAAWPLGHGAGVRILRDAAVVLEDLEFTANTATYGAALYANNSVLFLRNSLLWKNRTTSGQGTVLLTGNRNALIDGCTLANNPYNSGGIRVGPPCVAQITNCVLWGNGDELANCSATWSCIEDADAGTGNIAANPRFLNSGAGDFRLMPGSPCIDAGDASRAAPADLDGAARRDDPGAPNRGTAGPWADIGAYEFTGVSPLPPDFYVNDDSVAEPGSLCPAPGDDANDGLSPQRPMRSLQALLDRYPDIGYGMTLHVDPGLYPENLSIGPLHSGLTISGAGMDVSRIDGLRAGPCATLEDVADLLLADLGFRNGAGGVLCRDAKAELQRVAIEDCSAPNGAGLYATRFSDVTLRNSRLTRNLAAQSGGGVGIDGDSAVIIVGCSLTANQAGGMGGGLGLSDGAAVLHGNTLAGNEAADGGGVFAEHGMVFMTGNHLLFNVARHWGGGAAFGEEATGLLHDCRITENQAGAAGGGIDAGSLARVELRNCTLAANLAPGPGGGLRCHVYADALVENSILWGNVSATAGPEAAATLFSTLTFAYCDVRSTDPASALDGVYVDPGSTLTWGDGNIDADPLWYDADYTLSPGSPCIDAADSVIASPTDIAGLARRDDPGAPNVGSGPPWADIGAWEFQGISPPPSVYYVNDDAFAEPGSLCRTPGDDANDGYSPRTPMRHIQALFNKYPALGAGITIRIDPGLYTENITLDASRSGMVLHGAGAGRAVIDGNLAGSCLVLDGFATGTVRGLTLRNGRAIGATWPTGHGGGVRCINGTGATLADLEIAGNTATYGGALYSSNSKPAVVNCLIRGNRTTSLQGVVMFSGSKNPSLVNCTVVANVGGSGGVRAGAPCVPVIANCILWGNGDELYGCAATYSCIEDADPGIGNISADPLFLNAAASDFRLAPGSPCIDAADRVLAPPADIEGRPRIDDPGMPPNGAAYPDMGAYELAGGTQNDVVYVNDAVTGEPGALCPAPGNDANHGFSPRLPLRTIQGALNKYPAFGAGKTVRIDPGTYAENVAVAASHAGLALRGAGAVRTIVDGGQANTVFVLTNFGAGELSGLTLQNGKASGATAIDKSGGGIRLYGPSTALISECIIRRNSAGTGSGGGGVYSYNASPTLRNCLLYANTGTGCGGLRAYGGAVTVMNCTLANNTGGGVHRTGTGTLSIVNSILWANGDDLISCAATYSCIEDGDAGTGNIAQNPSFVNAAAGDYHLNSGSPCIDAGAPSGAPPIDLDDLPRDAQPDMGAYERAP